MYPMVCFTCGMPIAELWIPYFAFIGEAVDVEKKKTGKTDVDHHFNTNIQFEVLDKLNISSECCRRMFICQIESLYKDIF